MQVKEKTIWRHKCGVVVCEKCMRELCIERICDGTFFATMGVYELVEPGDVSGEQCADCLRYWR